MVRFLPVSLKMPSNVSRMSAPGWTGSNNVIRFPSYCIKLAIILDCLLRNGEYQPNLLSFQHSILHNSLWPSRLSDSPNYERQTTNLTLNQPVESVPVGVADGDDGLADVNAVALDGLYAVDGHDV